MVLVQGLAESLFDGSRCRWYDLRMTIQIAVRIADEIADELDRAVARGEFATRTEAIRVGLEALAKRLRDDEIAKEYRDAYGAKPQEEWVGAFGLTLLQSAVAGEIAANTSHAT